MCNPMKTVIAGMSGKSAKASIAGRYPHPEEGSPAKGAPENW
jgi:hypothetical protein